MIWTDHNCFDFSAPGSPRATLLRLRSDCVSQTPGRLEQGYALRLYRSLLFHSQTLTGGKCKAQVTFHRSVMMNDYCEFRLHVAIASYDPNLECL